MKVYVEGRLQTRSYTGQDNVQRTVTEIVIEDMMILTPKQGAPVSETPVSEPEKVTPDAEKEEVKNENVDASDIPF